MSHLIDVEQAVEAVRRTWAERSETVGDRPTIDEMLHAMNAIQPAEPTAEEVDRAQAAALETFREAWHDRPVDDAAIWRGVVLAVVAAMRGGR